jgi:hypothetical protein
MRPVAHDCTGRKEAALFLASILTTGLIGLWWPNYSGWYVLASYSWWIAMRVEKLLDKRGRGAYISR